MARRILLVDDDPSVLSALTRALGRHGAEVEAVGGGEAALGKLATFVPDVVLTDVRMPGMGGLELLRILRERAPQVDVVVMTGHDDLPTVAQAMKHGAVDMLLKPLDIGNLYRLLDRIAEDRAARTRGPAVASGAGDGPGALVGRDPRMLEVFKTVGRIAVSRAPVLIRGESGTGKELVARSIHAASDAHGEPFVAVNCHALPETLLESELFGHVKGAFTGATSSRQGCFAQAGRGTIFLDEIGDTPPGFQAKLLRVLQENEYSPVGGERREPVHARVITATHRPLEELVAKEEFREDLYYRLRVLEIVLPPLRERMGDVPVLVDHFVRKATSAAGLSPKGLTDSAVQALLAHDWPGNVRELENCLTRAVLTSPGDVIHPEHLALRPAGSPEEGTLPTLGEAERRHVASVLAFTGGNKSEAARILDISRPRLDRLIKKYGVEV
ncbi:MAG: sigma-54-dependent Fis family transcriptional regulator [Gemmatimonadota bacterium]